MWRMLTSRAKDLSVELVSRDADRVPGRRTGFAHYRFAQTGRPVVNDVHSQFRFVDGLIAAQVDDFDFHRWSRQALGLPGLLLGWTPMLRGSVQRKARAGLDKYLAPRRMIICATVVVGGLDRRSCGVGRLRHRWPVGTQLPGVA